MAHIYKLGESKPQNSKKDINKNNNGQQRKTNSRN
jgi:hypothetical protein